MKRLLFLLVVVFFSTTIYSFEYPNTTNNNEIGKVILIDGCRIQGTIYVEIEGEGTIPRYFDVTESTCEEAWDFVNNQVRNLLGFSGLIMGMGDNSYKSDY